MEKRNKNKGDNWNIHFKRIFVTSKLISNSGKGQQVDQIEWEVIAMEG